MYTSYTLIIDKIVHVHKLYVVAWEKSGKPTKIGKSIFLNYLLQLCLFLYECDYQRWPYRMPMRTLICIAIAPWGAELYSCNIKPRVT